MNSASLARRDGRKSHSLAGSCDRRVLQRPFVLSLAEFDLALVVDIVQSNLARYPRQLMDRAE